MSKRIVRKIKTMMTEVKRLDEEKSIILNNIKSLRIMLPKIYYITMFGRHGFKEGIHKVGTCDEMYDYVENELNLDHHYTGDPLERRKNNSSQIFQRGSGASTLVTGHIKYCNELDYEWKEISAILESQSEEN